MVGTAGAAVGGKRVAVFMPFSAGGVTGGESPKTHKPASIGGFAWDLKKSDGSAVYANMASSDGSVSLKVAYIGANGGGAGKTLRLSVSVNGTNVGQVEYEHVRNLQVSTSSPAFGPGKLVGYLGTGKYASSHCADRTADGWPWSLSWRVCTPGGIHTHTDFAKACYRDLPTNGAVSATTAIAMLSSAYSTTNKSVCDATELDMVAQTAHLSVANVGHDCAVDYIHADVVSSGLQSSHDYGVFATISGYPSVQWYFYESTNAGEQSISLPNVLLVPTDHATNPTAGGQVTFTLLDEATVPAAVLAHAGPFTLSSCV
jgi:hypothetical protein